MSPALRILPAALALLAAACQQKTVEAPWLTYPGLDGHARFLPLLGTSHDPNSAASVTCSSCHPGSTFTQPVCTGCHGQAATDGLHTLLATGQLLPGYEWTLPPPAPWQRPRCLECHPQGGLPDAAHHTFFPVGAGTKHATRTCLSCHGDPLDKQNVTKLLCGECHRSGVGFPAGAPTLDAAHALVVASPDGWDPVNARSKPQNCLRCHDGAAVKRIADHGKLPGPTGFGRAGPWDGVPLHYGTLDAAVYCFDCHKAAPPGPLFSGRGPGLTGRVWAQDWKIPATSASEQAGCVSETATPERACCKCHGPN